MKRNLLIPIAVVLALISSCKQNPKIVIETAFGDIEAELFPEYAPATVANFLYYVDKGLYNISCFYRVVRDDNQPNDSIRIAVIPGREIYR